jgi:hypothetical protein
MIDDMLAAMRTGKYDVKPLPQTQAPPRTWTVRQDAQVSRGDKSAGAQDQSEPNNPGGLDRDGIIMLDRILSDEARFKGRTKERLANVEPAMAEAIEE